MLSILEAVILGIVQGITEWLPISSSGHLVLLQELLGISVPVSFDVLLHIGTLLVLFVVFWNDLLDLAKKILFKRDKDAIRMALLIVTASIPTAVMGFFFKDYFESTFGRADYLAIGFFVSAIWIILSIYPKKKEKNVGFLSAFLIGIAQGISIFPSISRSGATIATALILGIKREEAGKFSFLIAIPAIAGAALLSVKDYSLITDIPAAAAGTITAAIFGFLSLKLLLNMIKKDQFRIFAVYCFAIGVVCFVLFNI